MLPKQTMDSIAAMMGITADVLAKAISDEQEVSLETPKGVFITEEQKAEMLDNHGKRKYDEGRTKEKKEAYDGKEKDAFLKEYANSILEEAKLEPNKKVEELNTTVENLRIKLQEKEGEFDGLKSNMAKEKRMFEIQSSIPDIPESVGISKEEATSLYLSGREFKEDGIYLNGKHLTDEYERSIDLSTDVKSWYEQKGWGAKPAGRGGGTQGATGVNSAIPKTMEEYEAYLEAKGLKEGSMEANAILREAAAANPEL